MWTSYNVNMNVKKIILNRKIEQDLGIQNEMQQNFSAVSVKMV